jgi:tetratricopeptide (TPR) repeat protein
MGKAKFKIDKKTILITVGVILLVGAAIGVGFLARVLQNSVANSGNNNNANVGPNSPTAKSPYPDAVNKAQGQAAAGDYQAAQQTLNQALAQPGDNDQKFLLLQQQGVVYTNQNQPQQALDVFLQALPLKPTDHTINQLIAEQYDALGNKDKAIEFYTNTIKYLDTSSPAYQDDKKEYQDRIVALGGTP